MAKIRAAIVGATGYTGAELLRILGRHPAVSVEVLTSREPGPAIADTYGHFQGLRPDTLEAFEPDQIAERADVVFVGLPHHAAMEAVAPLYRRGVRVVDLSADFRLRSLETYQRAYGRHSAPELLPESVYGLPELFRESIAGARLIASPGCYPTSVILPVAPLLRAGLVSGRGIIADCKSGVTGAGRGLGLSTHYCEVEGGLRAYKVAAHRHQPEMEEVLRRGTGRAAEVLFVPHLVPMKRGILASIYAELAEGVEASSVRDALCAAYAHERFVKVLEPGRWPDTAHVNGSNYVHLNVQVDAERRTVILLCALDNLVKGAAGAAVQCMNLACGLDEAAGLEQLPIFP